MNLKRLALLGCLLGCVLAQTARGQGTWSDRAGSTRSKFYLVRSDLPQEQTKELVDHMDLTCMTYMKLFSNLPVRAKRPALLHLYLFAEQQDYVNTLATEFNTNGIGSWGMCISRPDRLADGDRVYLVGFRGHHTVEECKPLLQHEGFHQFARHLFPDMPPWANEGTAEVFERGVAVDGSLALGELTEKDRRILVAALDQNAIRPLPEFFQIDGFEWGAHVVEGNARLNYLQAWSICHFMLYGEDSKHQTAFLRFLVALNRTDDWRTAFLAAIGNVDFAVLHQKWEQHLRTYPSYDYRDIVRRLRFLGAGMAELAKEEIFPQDMQELKAELRQRNFQHQLEIFGEQLQMSASDDRLFEVPEPTLPGNKKVENPASFLLVDRRNQPPRGKTRLPLRIVTDGLKPGEIVLNWNKRGKDWEPFLGVQPPTKRDASAESGSTPTTQTADIPASKREHYRIWTPRTQVPLEARLITISNGKVYLKTADGELVSFLQEYLNSEDQEFLEAWREE